MGAEIFVRLITKRQGIDEHEYEMGYTYNEKGQLKSKGLYDGSRLEYHYDENGRMIAVVLISPTGDKTTIIKQQHGNDLAGERRRIYGNDSERHLIYDGEQVKRITSGGLGFTYEYDGLGRIKELNKQGVTSQYSYDGQGRLVAVNEADRSILYHYDVVGNRTKEVVDSEQIGDYIYADMGQGNRLYHHSSSYLYNKAGSLLFDGLNRYEYTAKQQISHVFRDDELIAEYSYNIWGERIKKVIYADKQPEITYYLYESKRLVAEANEEGKISRQYLYLDQPQEDWSDREVRRRLHVFQQDQRLAQDEPNSSVKQPGIAANQQYINQEGDLKRYLEGFTPSADIDWYSRPQELIGQKIGAQYYWIHSDHLGAPHQMNDGNGEVVWSGDYEAFGVFTATEETQKLQIRFPGQYVDKETGLHYNYYRYYDPRVGRYTTADPLGLQGGMNLYAYAGNNPVSFIDPTGELVHAIPIGIEAVSALLAACGVALTAEILLENLGVVKSLALVLALSLNPSLSSRIMEAIKNAEVDKEEIQEDCVNGECTQAVQGNLALTLAATAQCKPDDMEAANDPEYGGGDGCPPCSEWKKAIDALFHALEKVKKIFNSNNENINIHNDIQRGQIKRYENEYNDNIKKYEKKCGKYKKPPTEEEIHEFYTK